MPQTGVHEKRASVAASNLDALSPLEDDNELRILLWGLTGVGKSKFIAQCGATALCAKTADGGQEAILHPQVGGGVVSSKSHYHKRYGRCLTLCSNTAHYALQLHAHIQRQEETGLPD